jgi:ribosomal protein L30E
MAKKKLAVDEQVEEIKELLPSGRLTIGTDTTMKALRAGKLEKLFVSKNAPEEILSDIEDIGGAETVRLNLVNTELGTVCKKPFVISILGLLKDESD